MELGRRDGGVRRVKMYEYAVPKSFDNRADETAMEMTRRSAVADAASGEGVEVMPSKWLSSFGDVGRPAATRFRPIDSRSSNFV